jgi:IS30 family transposase
LNSAAVLSENDVRDIRRVHSTGVVSQGELAEQYNVAQTTISAIVRRETWAHVD